MADVLNQVKQQTGAQFEMTGVSAADRVYAKLGPGAPKDVLAALLDGTRFNFAILGSASDPAAVARVVLMPRAAGGAGGTSGAANPQPAYRQPQPLPEEENPEEEMPVVEEEPPPPVEEQPSEQNPQQQPGQVKTPEQLLQELQQMQQQQQQNQQQNPPQQQIPDREIPD
jgi:outer membrane biosynthesis protein TonB